MIGPKWIRTSPKTPCPICKKPDWCMIGEKFVLCNREPSSMPASGGGYLHRIDGKRPVYKPPPKAQPEAPKVDFRAMLSTWAAQAPNTLPALADSLGVSVATLQALGATWANWHRAWAFPMADAWGNVVGIRLRNEFGRKWAVKGSSQGIFLPSVPHGNMLFVCEGPTDTAAILTLGMFAVGRPSCNGGALEIRALCRRLKITKTVILADHDDPGQDGARRFAAQLLTQWTIWTPPAKDAREWLRLGGTVELLRDHVESLKWQDHGR